MIKDFVLSEVAHRAYQVFNYIFFLIIIKNNCFVIKNYKIAVQNWLASFKFDETFEYNLSKLYRRYHNLASSKNDGLS